MKKEATISIFNFSSRYLLNIVVNIITHKSTHSPNYIGVKYRYFHCIVFCITTRISENVSHKLYFYRKFFKVRKALIWSSAAQLHMFI